jgi:uncharacterized protein involved in exopolysaccharide biosynthesis
MPKIDLKFYLAVFLRRLPYFAVIAALVTAVAATLAAILPPIYRSEASMLVEPQQIPATSRRPPSRSIPTSRPRSSSSAS